jgi:hypothetical protein
MSFETAAAELRAREFARLASALVPTLEGLRLLNARELRASAARMLEHLGYELLTPEMAGDLLAEAVEELGRQGHASDALARLVRETAELVTAARSCTRSDELALAVKALESRKAAAEDLLRQFIKPVETDPTEPENRLHNTTTSLMANQITDTVITSEDCSRGEANPSKAPPPPRGDTVSRTSQHHPGANGRAGPTPRRLYAAALRR